MKKPARKKVKAVRKTGVKQGPASLDRRLADIEDRLGVLESRFDNMARHVAQTATQSALGRDPGGLGGLQQAMQGVNDLLAKLRSMKGENNEAEEDDGEE